jgi:L-ascorbate metabolism protein UlaG (beta-lactamase superfamily)
MTPSSEPAPDRPTDQGEARVRFLGHATVLIEVGEKRVLTDPFLGRRLGPLERHGPTPDPRDLAVDLVLISHGHPDHFDRPSLAALPGRPRIVVPRGLGGALARDRSISRDVVEIAAGESIDIEGITVRAVAARHWISPGSPRAAPVGYLVGAEEAASRACPTVYFAGDTGRHARMRDLAGLVDVALLPIWTWGPHLGPGHLGPRSAAEVLGELRATTAIPIHWGTLYPRHLHRLWRRPLHQPAERFASYARRFAPAAEIRILKPGESVAIRAAR